MSKIQTIAVSDLSKSYSVAKGFFGEKELFKALEDISFSLFEGETLAVLGESGAGKSTLAKVLVGAELPSSGKLMMAGKDVFEDKTTGRLSRHYKIRMVYQDPYASLNPQLSINSLFDEPLRNFTQLDKAERKIRIVEVLNLVGLKSEHGRRLPHMFSAGERQRIAIARALILDPLCIVLDEPLSSLDISVQSQIVNLLLKLQKDLGLSYILITYNLSVIKHMSDQLMILCKGQMVEYGPTQDILDNPLHPYTKDILNKKTKILTTDDSKDADTVRCVYCDRCSKASDICHSKKPAKQLINQQIVYCDRVNEN